MARLTRTDALFNSNGNASPGSPALVLSPIIDYPVNTADSLTDIVSSIPAVSSSRTAQSVALERRRFRNQIGPYLFNGRRDLYSALGYPRHLTIDDYRDTYERLDVAARLIEFYPHSTWLPSVSVNEDDDPNITTTFETMWSDFDRRMSVISDVFMRADILARTYRYSVIVIGAPGDLSTELLPGNGSPDAIKYLTVLGEDRALITRMVGAQGVDENGRMPGDPGYKDPATSERFGLPLTYQCRLGVATNYFSTDGPISAATGALLERDVHWSRVWHVAHGTLDNKVYGQSMFRRVMNRLIDYEKVTGATAEAVWRQAIQKLHAKLDPSMVMEGPEEEKFDDQIAQMEHGLRSVIHSRGVDIIPLNGLVPSMKDNVDTLLRSVAASHGIPARVMTGSEEAKKAGEQDDNHTNDRQTEIWGRYATPQLSGFINRLIDYNYLPEPAALTIVWPEIEEHTEGEKATIAGTIALANSNQIKSGDTPIRSSAELRAELYDEYEPIVLPEKRPEVTQMPDGQTNNPGTSDTGADTSPADQANPANRSASLGRLGQSADPARRVLIIGGPRRGKSTLARELRSAVTPTGDNSTAIPTFCGDPVSLVKDPEPGVVYLPENLSWSESSQYIADNWLTLPGPWCCEGIAMARAVRKLVNSERSAVLDGADIFVLTDPVDGVTESSGQAIMARGVMTVWAEVADLFPQAQVIETGKSRTASASNASNASNASSSSRQPVSPRDSETWKVSMPYGRSAIASKKNHRSSQRFSFRVR